MSMKWILEAFPLYKILIEYDNIEQIGEKNEIHNLVERQGTNCMFCMTPFNKWGKKDVAHAISECVGNKKLINYCECYECNHLFGEIAENHLGKYIMPYRFINGIYGKGKNSNTIKDMPIDKSLSYKTYRFEQNKSAPVFESETFDVRSMLIELNGSGRFKRTDNGFTLSIPRQKYTPQLVYVSLLKMAYTLLPSDELTYYVKGLLSLYYYISKKPFYSETQKCDEEEQQKYINGLPNIGLEICISNKNIPCCVNVCLLKKNNEKDDEPKLLFALQMKWYTIVIPICSDNYTSGEKCSLKATCNKNGFLNFRKLDFKEIENEFVCDMDGNLIDIPLDLYPEIEENLKSKGLLRK